MGGHCRGLDNRQRFFYFIYLVNLFTAQKQLKLGGQLPSSRMRNRKEYYFRRLRN